MENNQIQNLKVVSVSETKEASDGRKYFTVKFSAGLGQRAASRNFWQTALKDKEGNPTGEFAWERGTPEEAQALLEAGGTIEGTIVTAAVEEYMIPRGEDAIKANTYRAVVFPDETPEAVFAQNGHPMLDEETGEVLKHQSRIILGANKVEEKVEEKQTA